MANDGKFLTVTAGGLTQESAINTSAGAADGGKIIKLDAGGKIDSTMLPLEAGSEFDVVASENLSQGDVINLFNDSGTLKARKADATDGTKPGDGYAVEAISSAGTGTIHVGNGTLTKTSHGFTLGARLYLATTAGAMTETPPSGSGNLVQRVGKVIDANTVAFTDDFPGVTLA